MFELVFYLWIKVIYDYIIYRNLAETYYANESLTKNNNDNYGSSYSFQDNMVSKEW